MGIRRSYDKLKTNVARIVDWIDKWFYTLYGYIYDGVLLAFVATMMGYPFLLFKVERAPTEHYLLGIYILVAYMIADKLLEKFGSFREREVDDV